MSEGLSITLVDAQPYFSARRKLCEVLDHGTKKLAFACAFLTEPGLASIIKHTRNLELPESFAVFSFEEPTSPQSLAKLFKKYPQNIYVHYGTYLREYEPQFPRGIMHSKLFFASDGVTAKVWCGSHNLTGNALHRKNIEVATLVEGACDHPYFKDVENHLEGCRIRARNELRQRISGTDGVTFVVEMEHDDIDGLLASLKKDNFIKLKPLGTKDQPRLQPNRDYAIRLYKPGKLKAGAPASKAYATIRGKITALNLNKKNPAKGTKAKFSKITHTVIETSGDHFEISPGNIKKSTMVDAVLRITEFGKEKKLYLSRSPRTSREVNCCLDICRDSAIPDQDKDKLTRESLIDVDESRADSDVSGYFKTRTDADFILIGKGRFWTSKWSTKLK
jgi:hypothetical protein